jgi:DNA invertase Pin-like site-specific DNA recombinase
MNQEAILPWHLERIAFVYLRQSSPSQVRRNTESAARQRRMQQHVAALGWPDHQINVLGGDTGNSGSSQHGRDDYQGMLEAVVAQRAGLICACELSRLVRDNQDWNQLVRICRYKGVLLADEHRVYNPANSQDRVLLGIQGAFTEYELAMITERMQQSRAQKAARGELYEGFPPGYISRHESLYEKHPDPRVQRAIEKVFREFESCPSGLQLLRRLLEERFRLPMVPHGKDWRDVEWRTPLYRQLMDMLRNPAYAGIYVRGRYKTFTVLDDYGHTRKKRRRMPREQWEVFLEGHHDAYISKAAWERNLAKIADNAHMSQAMCKQSPQNGTGLMVGLLRCRRCGHKLHAAYNKGRVSYVCRGGDTQRNARGKCCFCFRATRVEERLAEIILEAICPAAIAAAREAAEQLAANREQERQLIVDRIEAHRETEMRAAREYKKTDATYATVRQKLSREWEEALLALQRQQEELNRFDSQRPQAPTAEQQRELDKLKRDVRTIWHHPKASMVLKKQIVRTLVEEIVADLEKPQNDIVLTIHWAGGHHTVLREPTHWKKQPGARKDLKRIIGTLRKVLEDDAIATVLNRSKLRTSDGATWTASAVAGFRKQYRIRSFSAHAKAQNGWMTQADAATCLGISPMSMTRLVQIGIIPAQQPHPGMPCVIKQSSLNHERVQRAVKQLKESNNRPLSQDPNQLNLFENNNL